MKTTQGKNTDDTNAKNVVNAKSLGHLTREGAKTQWTATRPKGTQQNYTVNQRNDIDWEQVRQGGPKDFVGKTNFEAATKRGLAPELPDGSFVTLHHIGQNSKGPLVEASTRYHGDFSKSGQNILHGQFGKKKPHPEHPVDHGKFRVDTREYWKWRVSSVPTPAHVQNPSFKEKVTQPTPETTTGTKTTKGIQSFKEKVSGVENKPVSNAINTAKSETAGQTDSNGQGM